MLKVSQITGLRVLLPKKPKTAKDGTQTERFSKLGKVHMAVFSPNGKRVVGLMVRRPDVVGMVKREDAFLALDSFALSDKNLVVERPSDGLDAAARKRLGLDWDRCIMWTGMDVRTTEGKPLGYVSDVEFDERTGAVTRFLSTDGGMAQALIGSFQIAPEMVRGYSNGCMVVETDGALPPLDGGVAAAAGEGYARAKAGASEMGKKAGAAAGKAVDKGSFALGKLIGKAQRAISEATAEEPELQAAPEVAELAAADVRVEKPVEGLPNEATEERVPTERPEPKTYVPADEQSAGRTSAPAGQSARSGVAAKATPAAKAKKAASSTKKTASKASSAKAAKAVSKQLGSFGKMFGSFADEFKKASK